MPGTSKEYGPFDGSIHNDDGSHRTTAPTTEQGKGEAWRRRRDAHVAQHVADARRANDLLPDDELLCNLADQVAFITEGQVYFLYTTRPSVEVYYVFQGIDGRRNRTETIRALTRFLAERTVL